MRSLQVSSLVGPRGVEVAEVPEPTPNDGDLVVEVKAVGVSSRTCCSPGASIR